ncbi:SCO4402 family protein [Endozoicomonas arenosclerae]|uniref:SCO4402 family protein n=1 Tax=Endozoicomonas arenosclerae TaxID=1633495 RepID=UPI000B0DB08D|nr:hypothetical protein [Endozoicomonas arenosclerae]
MKSCEEVIYPQMRDNTLHSLDDLRDFDYQKMFQKKWQPYMETHDSMPPDVGDWYDCATDILIEDMDYLENAHSYIGSVFKNSAEAEAMIHMAKVLFNFYKSCNSDSALEVIDCEGWSNVVEAAARTYRVLNPDELGT